MRKRVREFAQELSFNKDLLLDLYEYAYQISTELTIEVFEALLIEYNIV